MSTAKKRKAITIQLNPNTDADLIAAIEVLPEGQRNAEIKKALRLALRLNGLEWDLTSGLERLSGQLEGVKQAIEGATLAYNETERAVEPVARMDESEKARRAANINRNNFGDW